MSVINTFECDVCHIQKSTTNGWFKTFEMKGRTTEGTFGDAYVGLLIVDWEYDAVSGRGDVISRLEAAGATAHLCGDKCAREYTNAFIHKRNMAHKKEIAQ